MNRIFLPLIFFAVSLCGVAQSHLPTAIKIEFFNQQLADKTVDDATKAAYVDSLLALSHVDSCRLLCLKGDLCFASLKYRHAASAYIKALNFSALNEAQICHLLYNIGLSHYYTGKYDQSIKYAQKLQGLEKEDSLECFDIYAYTLLCNNYIRFQRLDLAWKYIDDAQKRLKKIFLTEGRKNDVLCLFHRTLASVYRSKEDYQQAFAEISEARKYSVDNLSALSCDLISATIYEKNTEPEIAAQFYTRILANPIKHYHKAVALNNYIFYLLQCREYASIISIYESDKALIDSLQNEHLRLSIYNTIALAYGNLNDFKSGYTFLNIASEISDSLFSYENRKYISDITHSYELSQLSDANNSLSRQKETLALVLVTIGVMLLLAVAAIFLLLRKMKRVKRRESELRIRLDNFDKFHADTLRTSYDEIDSKNRKLVTLTMQMAQINDTLNNIIRQISDAETTDTDKLKTIASEIKTLNYQENMWNTFRVYFEDSHKTFFDNLFRRHPDLSNGEIKMCAYTLMNMTSKEIAQLTNRSVRTVENIKYRLTKKLGISSEDVSLYTYLQTLATKG